MKFIYVVVMSSTIYKILVNNYEDMFSFLFNCCGGPKTVDVFE